MDKKFKKTEIKKGFTVIEMLVVIFAFALIWGATMAAITMMYRTQSYTFQQSLAVNEARKGVEVMSREIREARFADNGAYPIELGAEKEFIFYSDIDQDGQVERVRYFLAMVSSGSQTKDCYSDVSGGTCTVVFNNFLTGTLKSAQVRISVEGDLGASNEYVDISLDGSGLGRICQNGCSDCAGVWQGTQTYDITTQAQDNSIQFLADASNGVGPSCSWQNPNHSMKTQFEFIWTEEVSSLDNQLRKGVIEPTSNPVTYPLAQEQVSIISACVRNAPPIFEYFDKDGNKITDDPAILKDTKMMKVLLVINVNPNRPPSDYELETYVQLRNLKEE